MERWEEACEVEDREEDSEEEEEEREKGEGEGQEEQIMRVIQKRTPVKSDQVSERSEEERVVWRCWSKICDGEVFGFEVFDG